MEGITEADGSYSMDAVLEQGERSMVLNINSLPGENDINSIRISRGRKPEKSSEAVVEEKFFQEYKLNLDDTIVLKSGNDSNIEDSLKNNEFKIVGTAMSPLYVSAQRPLSSVGNGNVRGFVYILPEVFKTKVYTEIYVRAQSIESADSLLDNESYKKAVESVEQSLKDIGTARGEIRYADVIKTIAERIDEAEQELNASKKEAEEKFADASRELNDARNKIEDGWKELERNEALFNKEMSKGKKQIEDGKKQIKVWEDELNTKIEGIERSRLQLSEGKNQLDESQLKLNEGKKAAVDNISSGIAQAVSYAKKQMESSPLNPVHAAKYNFLNNVYENNIKGKGFDSIYNSLKRDNVLDDLKHYIDIEALKADFDKAQSDIDAGRLYSSA